MAVEPIWLTFDDVEAIHADQLRRHGGIEGHSSAGLVASAVHAPRHLYLYDNIENPLVLAIRLCFAIAKNHGYLDGNKRTAAFAMIEFLAVNGYELFVPDDDPDEPMLGQWVERLTRGDYDERRLYDRLEHFVQEVG